MAERVIQFKKKKDESLDVKIAEGGKKLKIVEGAVAVGVGVFNPVLGAGMLVFEGAQWVAADKYVKWRTKDKAKQLPKAA